MDESKVWPMKIEPSNIQGSLHVPPSKSHSQRALIFAMMAKGTSRIGNILISPDVEAMMLAISSFGAKVIQEGSSLTVEGGFSSPDDIIDAGNSGQILRFLGALAALLPNYTVLTGDRSVRMNRPIKPLLGALRQLGALAESARGDGKAPISIRGPIHPGRCRLDGQDSQPVSALLMATSFLDGETEIFVDSPGETPWIDLTLDWLHQLGGDVVRENYRYFKVKGPLSYPGFSYTVPGDFSSAAFPLCAALATGSSLSLTGLDKGDVQGDKKVLEILQKMGAEFVWEKNALSVSPSQLKGIEIDINDCIDALPILSVMGCFAKGSTRIFNGAIARKKESDRIAAITFELRKMGAHIEEKEDGLVIHESKLCGAELYSHADHRIALSLSVAAMGASSASYLEGGMCIQKSYPEFFKDFSSIGAKVEQLDSHRV